MDPINYKILHVISLLVLSGWIFMSFANPAPERRKKTLMITGIAGLLMLVSGFGMMAKYHYGYGSTWVIVKVVCWLGLMALGGMAFRKPGKTCALTAIVLVLLSVAVTMVYTKPGHTVNVPAVPDVLQK